MEEKDIKIVTEYIKNALIRVTGKELEIKIEKSKYNNRYDFETSYFNTIPAIFKNVCVYGEIFISEDEENKNFIEIGIRLKYGFNYFNGGSNGTELGTMFLIKSKATEMISIKTDFAYTPQSNIYNKDIWKK